MKLCRNILTDMKCSVKWGGKTLHIIWVRPWEHKVSPTFYLFLKIFSLSIITFRIFPFYFIQVLVSDLSLAGREAGCYPGWWSDHCVYTVYRLMTDSDQSSARGLLSNLPAQQTSGGGGRGRGGLITGKLVRLTPWLHSPSVINLSQLFRTIKLTFSALNGSCMFSN